MIKRLDGNALDTLALAPHTNRVAIASSNECQHTLYIFDITPAKSRLDFETYTDNGNSIIIQDNTRALFKKIGIASMNHTIKKLAFFNSTFLGTLLDTQMLTFFNFNSDTSTIVPVQARIDIPLQDFAVHRSSKYQQYSIFHFALLDTYGKVYYGNYNTLTKNTHLSLIIAIPALTCIENFFYDENELRFVYHSKDNTKKDTYDDFRKITKIVVYKVSE